MEKKLELLKKTSVKEIFVTEELQSDDKSATPISNYLQTEVKKGEYEN